MAFNQIMPYWKGEKPAVIDRGDKVSESHDGDYADTFGNMFPLQTRQIQQLGQWPGASNYDALPTPLVSVFHMKGSTVIYNVWANFQNKSC